MADGDGMDVGDQATASHSGSGSSSVIKHSSKKVIQSKKKKPQKHKH